MMGGTISRSSRSRYGANWPAFFPSPKYSIQPDESTTAALESIVSVTIALRPPQTRRHSPQLSYRLRDVQIQRPIHLVHQHFLPRTYLQLSPQLLRYNDLELRRYHYHRCHIILHTTNRQKIPTPK